jgi:hypothetical protein
VRVRWDGQELRIGRQRVLTRDADLIRARHVTVEDLASEGDEPGMGDPGAVVSRPDLAHLVGANLRQRELARFGIPLIGI